LAKLKGDKILLVIGISIWIQNVIEGFFTIAIGQTAAEFRAATWQT